MEENKEIESLVPILSDPSKETELLVSSNKLSVTSNLRSESDSVDTSSSDVPSTSEHKNLNTSNATSSLAAITDDPGSDPTNLSQMKPNPLPYLDFVPVIPRSTVTTYIDPNLMSTSITTDTLTKIDLNTGDGSDPPSQDDIPLKMEVDLPLTSPLLSATLNKPIDDDPEQEESILYEVELPVLSEHRTVSTLGSSSVRLPGTNDAMTFMVPLPAPQSDDVVPDAEAVPAEGEEVSDDSPDSSIGLNQLPMEDNRVRNWAIGFLGTLFFLLVGSIIWALKDFITRPKERIGIRFEGRLARNTEH